ncbi:MAG: DUF1684 domain-containing protein [Thermomicrobiales bacterium]|nr:DUF1684 domain-containing protein [Thermomicrobiales bacterium]
MTTNSRLEGFRERKDVFFKTNESSPLTEEQKEIFEHLNYYPENSELNLVLELDTTGEGVGEEITVGTESGGTKQYVRLGRIVFSVDGEDAKLSVFQDTTSGKFFLPFRDTTAGNETYPVGRYVDPKARPDGKLNVDFNMAYNPYCAYNTGWSCVIPPFENRITVPIRAGETNPPFEHE